MLTYFFVHSALSSLDNETKGIIEDVVQRGEKYGRKKEDNFTEQAPVTNLSEKAFLKRKNITLEDVQAYYDKDKRLSEIDLLNKIDAAKQNNGIENYTEAMNKLRGELAVKYVMETEQVDYNVVNRFSNDIRQGFRDNADALKKLGVAIPNSVMEVLKSDEQLKNDIKFIDEARDFKTFDNGQDNKLELLNQVTEKGFSAGYGVELLVLESGKALVTNRKTYEARKKRLDKGLNEREQYNQTKERYEILEEIIRSTNIDGLCEMGLNQDDILKMAIDKVTGKDVKDMEAPKPTSGVERWFMGGKAKAKEKADIEAKQKACNNINNFVKAFSDKFGKRDTKFADNNPVALLKKYSSFDEISKQLSKDYNLMNSYRGYTEQAEKEDRAFIENFEKMETAYKTAQAKLDSQIAITKVARETSGVKDIETNTGFDAMATKAQIRKKNPDMPVRELYATMKEVRDKGEYSPEIKVKEPKADKTRSDGDKVSTLRGTKSQDVKQPVKQTTLSHQSMQNRSNSNG